MKRFYMLFLVLLAFSGWIYVADAQDASTWMPDADLRKSVRSALSIANGENVDSDRYGRPDIAHRPELADQ